MSIKFLKYKAFKAVFTNYKNNFMTIWQKNAKMANKFLKKVKNIEIKLLYFRRFTLLQD